MGEKAAVRDVPEDSSVASHREGPGESFDGAPSMRCYRSRYDWWCFLRTIDVIDGQDSIFAYKELVLRGRCHGAGR